MRVQQLKDISIIRDEVEIPVLGVLNVNAYVIHSEQPVLVDTGRPVVKEEFMAALRSVIDPAKIRWIWLTHPDRDHTGAMMDVLEAAPEARLVTSFMGFGYLGVEFLIPPPRAYLLNPGQALDVGAGRSLRAFRPPLYDSPMTTGFFDSETGTCFSSDCFGAPLTVDGAATADDVSAIDPAELEGAQLLWAGADSPWVCTTDPVKFATTYDEFRAFAPQAVLSTHLPPAIGVSDRFLNMLSLAPTTAPFVGPDQAALEALLAGMPEPAPA